MLSYFRLPTELTDEQARVMLNSCRLLYGDSTTLTQVVVVEEEGMNLADWLCDRDS